MSRTPTTTDTTVEWEEKVTDPDSDQLTITLVLDAVDDGSGFTNDGTDSSNLSWLSFSEDKSTLADGTTEVLVNIVADKSGLDQGYSYRFKITADDGTTAVDRTFTLSIDIRTRALWVAEGDSDRVPKFVFGGKAEDISTLTYDKGYDISASNIGSLRGIHFKPDGTMCWASGWNDDKIAELDLDSAWDLSSFTETANVGLNNPGAVYLSEDGTYLAVYLVNDEDIKEYDLSTPFDFSTRTARNNYNATSNTDFPEGFEFADGGSKLYIPSGGSDGIQQYTLGTPHDLTTASFDGSTNSSDDGNGVSIRSSGKKLYIMTGVLYEYDVGTAYDIAGGVTQVRTFDLVADTSIGSMGGIADIDIIP